MLNSQTAKTREKFLNNHVSKGLLERISGDGTVAGSRTATWTCRRAPGPEFKTLEQLTPYHRHLNSLKVEQEEMSNVISPMLLHLMSQKLVLPPGFTC